MGRDGWNGVVAAWAGSVIPLYWQLNRDTTTVTDRQCESDVKIPQSQGEALSLRERQPLLLGGATEAAGKRWRRALGESSAAIGCVQRQSARIVSNITRLVIHLPADVAHNDGKGKKASNDQQYSNAHNCLLLFFGQRGFIMFALSTAYSDMVVGRLETLSGGTAAPAAASGNNLPGLFQREISSC